MERSNRGQLMTSVQEPVLLAEIPDGTELYTMYCARCHGLLDGSTKRDKSTWQISQAINNISAMASIKLSATEINLIEIALRLSKQDQPEENMDRVEQGQLETDAIVGAASESPGFDPTSGVELYSMHCARCHSPLDSSTKRGRKSSQIFQAIGQVPKMTSIKLSSEEANLIELSLRVHEITSNSPMSTTNVAAPIGNAVYMASVLTEIFDSGGVSAENKKIKEIITSYVENQRLAFGGPCLRYDKDCPGKDLSVALVNPNSSVLRKGYYTKACREILSIDLAVSNALSKVGLTTSEQATSINLGKVFRFFYLGRTPSSEIYTKLATIFQKAKAQDKTQIDAWRYTLLPLCVSSSIDLL